MRVCVAQVMQRVCAAALDGLLSEQGLFVCTCCTALQRVAAYGSVLQLCCSVLQCIAVCCNMLQHVAACISVLQCVAVCCSVL